MDNHEDEKEPLIAQSRAGEAGANLTDVLGVTAYLNWSLEVDCPKCEETTDLSDADDDGVYGNAIFNNNWDALKGTEATCSKCGHEFKISEVVY